MKLVVNDANILIDLVKLHMLPDFFALDLEFHTTALVLDELYDEQKEELQSYIDSGTLHVNELEAEEMMEVFDLQAQRPVLSPQDCSALFCAEKLGGALISSDKNLRNFAKTKTVEVHGHLWIFDSLVEKQIYNGGKACTQLEALQQLNTKLNLPKHECEKRMKLWAAM